MDLSLARRRAGPGLVLGAALCAALAWAAPARAAEIEICFGYSCYRQARAIFADDDLRELRELLAPAADAAAERDAIARAVGRMYAIAARQTPIWRDRGRNTLEERHLEGAMDCIDHSTNTGAFLHLLWREGMLRHHRPASAQRRFAFLVFGEHWSASLVANDGGEQFAVDTWFLDPGLPATVVTLSRWKAGYDPEDAPEATR
ncbi:MAG: hypothetical protein JNM90_11310 [Burkholderiales bacterium]|nr:hypothetical protein [Burkholderiales bacterium]